MELAPIEFGREIAVFPLPNCVLFPGVVQPLHIFEPRYREMMREVLGEGAEQGSLAMAMGLLKAGWEKEYYGCPAIHEMVCVGRVIAHEMVEDGKYNLLLQGVVRARVRSESRRTGEWGVYRVGMLEPVLESGSKGAHEALQRKVLKELFERTALKELTVTPTLAAMFEEGVPLGRLVDALAFSVVQDVETKQRLLEEVEVGARGELLLRELVALAGRLGAVSAGRAGDASWPPTLGVN